MEVNFSTTVFNLCAQFYHFCCGVTGAKDKDEFNKVGSREQQQKHIIKVLQAQQNLSEFASRLFSFL
jgi:hypothetical protein